MTRPTDRPPAPGLDAYEAAIVRVFEKAPPAPESFGLQVFPGLTHPLTGEPVARWNPAAHGQDNRWLAVTCTRCGREFVNTPWDELMTPAPDLGWAGGDVCEPCLYRLASAKVAAAR